MRTLVRAVVLMSPFVFCNGESMERSPAWGSKQVSLALLSVCIWSGWFWFGTRSRTKKANILHADSNLVAAKGTGA